MCPQISEFNERRDMFFLRRLSELIIVSMGIFIFVIGLLYFPNRAGAGRNPIDIGFSLMMLLIGAYMTFHFVIVFLNDRPYRITRKAIYFTSRKQAPIKYSEIVKIGWLNSVNEKRTGIAIKTKKRKIHINAKGTYFAGKGLEVTDFDRISTFIEIMSGKQFDPYERTKKWYWDFENR